MIRQIFALILHPRIKEKIRRIVLLLTICTVAIEINAQTCTSNPSTINSDVDFASITWTATGGATVTQCNEMADGTSAFTGDVVIDLGNNDKITISNNVTIDGDFLLSGGNGSTLEVSGGGTPTLLKITGDLGDSNSNGVAYSVPNANDSIRANGTIYGKNNNAFSGSGGISGGTLDVKNGTSCGSPCPVEGNFANCSSGDAFCTNNAVPIDLTYFKAQTLENSVELLWQTASEEMNDFFTLERSSSGFDFNTLASIKGAGNSFEVLDYKFEDKNPYQGVSYYRLKQTDYDGTSETFKVVAVEFYGTSVAITVSQKLGDRELLISNNMDEENIAFMYDMMGRGGKIGTLKVGENIFDLDQIDVQSGIYSLRVVNSLGHVLTTQKFVVQ